jgi:hypothetical protein
MEEYLSPIGNIRRPALERVNQILASAGGIWCKTLIASKQP